MKKTRRPNADQPLESKASQLDTIGHPSSFQARWMTIGSHRNSRLGSSMFIAVYALSRPCGSLANGMRAAFGGDRLA